MSAVIVLLAIVSLINLALLGRLAIRARGNLRTLHWRIQRLRGEAQASAGRLKLVRKEMKSQTARISKQLKALAESAKENQERLRDGQRELALLGAISDLRFPHPFFLTGWTIDGFLAHRVVELLEERRPKTVLELGSGASTVLIATLFDRLDISATTHLAVDHLPEYLRRTEQALLRQRVTKQPRLLLCPLTSASAEGIPWYSGLVEQLAGLKIDLVLVDGPPGGDHPMSRFPALDIVRPFLAAGATVLLDDVQRPAEAEIVSMWSAAHPDLKLRMSDHGKGYAEFTVPDSSP